MKFKFFILALFVASCNFFEARSPEEPDSGNVSFPPPTTVDILIQNFSNSIKQKRTDNYSDCFLNQSDKSFSFTPSQDVYSIYPSYFVNWDYETERRYFQSLVSALADESDITLSLIKPNFNYISPDSTHYTAEYTLNIPLANSSIGNTFKGKIQLTIVPLGDGTFRLSRWYDSPLSSSDTIYPTWSLLKAKYFN